MSEQRIICWLIEAPNPKGPTAPRGYIRDIDRIGTFDVYMTTDPFKAMRFSSKVEAELIINDESFLRAMGDDKGFVAEEHEFIGEEPEHE